MLMLAAHCVGIGWEPVLIPSHHVTPRTTHRLCKHSLLYGGHQKVIRSTRLPRPTFMETRFFQYIRRHPHRVHVSAALPSEHCPRNPLDQVALHGNCTERASHCKEVRRQTCALPDA